MIDVEPMPNELSLAHEGRLAWINGCTSAKEVSHLIGSALIERGFDIVDMPKLHQLALVSNLAPTTYARKHSMLPVLRVSAKPGADVPHGAANAQSYSRRLGMLTQRQGVYCCIKCIEEDIQHRNISWFKRIHHLIGVDWCPVHGCALSRINEPNALSRVPHIWLAEDKLKPAGEPIQLPGDGFLRRYVNIATALLDRDRPLPVGQVNVRLAQRARKLGLRIGRAGRRPLISDRLFELAPAAWLERHLPGYETKTSLVHFQRIDCLVSMKTCVGTGDAYAMAMTALYESAEEAVLDVTSSETGNEPFFPTGTSGKRGARFWRGEIWPYYLESRGTLKKMADLLQMDSKYVGQMLSTLGLPSMHDIDHSPKWQAFVRFCGGQTLVDSCTQEEVGLVELENLLRKCSAHVFLALQKIRAMPQDERTKKTTRSSRKK